MNVSMSVDVVFSGKTIEILVYDSYLLPSIALLAPAKHLELRDQKSNLVMWRLQFVLLY